MGDKFESFRSLNLLVFEQHFVSEHLARGISSVGRASGWQPEGQGFESPILHSNLPTYKVSACQRKRYDRKALLTVE